ncbi:MAG: hypothetical protein ACLFN2_07335 [Bacteroidales bacterium]
MKLKLRSTEQLAFSFLPWVIFALVTLASGTTASAQFLRLQLVVEKETGVSRAREMDPGTIPARAGWVEMGLTDEFAGRFSIGAPENINVKVSVDAPAELVLDAANLMPLNLRVAYLNDRTENPRNAIPFPGESATFALSNCGCLVENMDPDHHQPEAHLLFYGGVYAGDIRPGVYRGTVTVRVEYE